MLNKIFFILCISFSYWAFTDFMPLQAESIETASLWLKFGSFWPVCPALLVHFSLVYSENKKLLKKKLTYFLMYAPTLFFSVIYLTTNLISGEPQKTPWGYTNSLPENPLVYSIITILLFGMAFLAIVTCVEYYGKQNTKNKRKQAKFVVAALSIPIFSNFLSQILFIANEIDFPDLTVVSSFFSAVLIGYTIWKYQLFDVNVETAAENIIAIMPDSLVLIDPEGKIVAINQSLTQVLGYGEDEVVGNSPDMLFNEKGLTSKIFEKTSKNVKLKNFETKFKAKSGKEIEVIISASMIRNNQDKISGIVAVVHDVTEKKQMEKRVLKYEKSAVLGQAATMVGHDLRNPLQAIQNANYVIQVQLKKLDKTNLILENSLKMSQIIDDSIEYANNIVLDLKDFSSERKAKSSKVNINELMEDSLVFCNIPKNVEIIKELTEVLITEVDKSMIKRVFVNIISNGVQAMPDGGTLKISTKKTNDFVEVCFKDTGSGISEENMKKLFSPFFTTKAQGMGMGLAICKKFVESNGGCINVESQETIGSAFTVRIPSLR